MVFFDHGLELNLEVCVLYMPWCMMLLRLNLVDPMTFSGKNVDNCENIVHYGAHRHILSCIVYHIISYLIISQSTSHEQTIFSETSQAGCTSKLGTEFLRICITEIPSDGLVN